MFHRFPSIEGFHNVRKNATRLAGYFKMPVTYRGKAKLHGTNAGVTITKDGSVHVQSRKREITPMQDNAGFADWVHRHMDYFKSLRVAEDITIFGEWAGPGVQKGVASSEAPKKFFAVFAILIHYPDLVENEDARFSFEPSYINHFLTTANVQPPTDLYVLPWETPEIEINWIGEIDHLQEVADGINTKVEEVERCDPFMRKAFNIEGLGEGLVYYPVHANNHDGEVVEDLRSGFSGLAFKAKGEAHRVQVQKRAAQISPEKISTFQNFAKMFVTDARCEQIVSENFPANDDINTKNTGPFLKALCEDVYKESLDELQANGLEWQQVNKQVQAEARNWWLRRCSQL